MLLAGNWTPEQLADADNLKTGVTVAIISWLAITAGLLFMRSEQPGMGMQNQQRPLQRRNAGIARQISAVLLLVLLVVIPIGNLVIRCCYFVRPVDGMPTTGYSISAVAGDIESRLS